MQSDVASYELARAKSPVSRPDDEQTQISCRFGIKLKMHGQAKEQLVIIKSAVQDFSK